ncbi:MAG: hypothetical protein AAFV53_25380 [Myxococcota bacterium]
MLKTFVERPDGWSQEQRQDLGRALRALYFQMRQDPPGAPDLIRHAADLLEPTVVIAVRGVDLCFHPTRTHRALRIIPIAEIPTDAHALFCPGAPAGFAAGFVDPETFCFRTFENILPLDPWFQETTAQLSDRQPIGDRILTFRLKGPARRLHEIDEANLYVAPLNQAQRGGRRLIFHAHPLAAALTDALRQALEEEMLKGFVSVNPVFRMSRFEPTDQPFARHRDAPYRDASRGHLSRYTLLIYVTGGRGAPALSLEDGATLEEIAPMTCVIFPQALAHEGHPYGEGAKVLVRSELIFAQEEGSLSYEPSLGRLFTRATYLTGACVFAPELSPYEHDAYDRVAQAHWSGRLPEIEVEPFFHKTFDGVDFVTNGHDLWVRDLSLKEAAALAVLDHFNARTAQGAFHTLCKVRTLQRSGNMNWVPAYLAANTATQDTPWTAALPKEILIPPAETVDPTIPFPERVYDFGDGLGWSKEYHIAREAQIVATYTQARERAMRLLGPAPIMLLGQEVFLDERRIVIEGDKIHVLSDEPMQPVHFAAVQSWTPTPEAFVGTEVTLHAPYWLIPPMVWRRVRGCWHLRLDFFRNGWMVRVAHQEINIPFIDDSGRA